MALKNTLTIVCMLFAVFSCSMDDELINNIDNAKNNNVPALAGQAAISLNIDMPKGIATRAAEGYEDPTVAESNITNCSLILLDGESKVIKAIDGCSVKKANGTVYKGTNSVDELTALDTVKFVVKVGDAKNYKVMVVANSSIKFEKFTTLGQIQDAIQTTSEYGKFVKVGTGNVVIDSNWEGYPGYATIEEAQVKHAVNVQVQLTQLEARIEVASFAITGFNDLSIPQDVVLKKIEFSNLYKVSFTNKDAQAEQIAGVDCYVPSSVSSKAYDIKVYDATKADNAAYEFNETEKLVVYSFRNDGNDGVNFDDNKKPVSVRIYYTVGGQDRKTKEIIIDKGSVVGGNLYRLNVTMNALNYDDIEVTVKCYTEDWIPNELSYTIK